MKSVSFNVCRNTWPSTTTYHRPNQETMTLVQQLRSSRSILVCQRQEKWTKRRWTLWRNRAVETRTLKKKQVASKDSMLRGVGLRQVLRIMSNILVKTCRSQISRMPSLKRFKNGKMPAMRLPLLEQLTLVTLTLTDQVWVNLSFVVFVCLFYFVLFLICSSLLFVLVFGFGRKN